jgi:hypothetical protein
VGYLDAASARESGFQNRDVHPILGTGHITGIENVGLERTLELIPTLTLSEPPAVFAPYRRL